MEAYDDLHKMEDMQRELLSREDLCQVDRPKPPQGKIKKNVSWEHLKEDEENKEGISWEDQEEEEERKVGISWDDLEEENNKDSEYWENLEEERNKEGRQWENLEDENNKEDRSSENLEEENNKGDRSWENLEEINKEGRSWENLEEENNKEDRSWENLEDESIKEGRPWQSQEEEETKQEAQSWENLEAELSKHNLLQDEPLKYDRSKKTTAPEDWNRLQDELQKYDRSKETTAPVDRLTIFTEDPLDFTTEDMLGENISIQDMPNVDYNEHQSTEDAYEDKLAIEDIVQHVLVSADLDENIIPNEDDVSNEEIPNEDTANEEPEGPPEEPLPKEDLIEEYVQEKSSSLSLYVGNLNPRFSKEILTCMLKDILSGINVTLQRHDIEVIKKGKSVFAFVHLNDDNSYESVMTQFKNPSNLDQSLLREFVKKGKTLKVDNAKTSFREMAESVSDHETSAKRYIKPRRKRKDRSEMESQSQYLTSSRSDSPAFEWDSSASILLFGTKSESAIVKQEIVGRERFFHGALLGSETRNVEFKRGGGEYMTITLKHHIRKYTCAFLNSEGGSLLVGVEDSGAVLGVQCNHKDEDRIRLLVDSILKGFKPPLFPEAYSLTFIPVVKPGDTGLFLKVIRLTVHRPKEQNEPVLYETDQGEVYLRRDGSVQGPLSGSAIQEWCRQKWVVKLKELEDRSETLMQEKMKLQDTLHSQSMSVLPVLQTQPQPQPVLQPHLQLQLQLQPLEITGRKKKTKSTICSIM